MNLWTRAALLTLTSFTLQHKWLLSTLSPFLWLTNHWLLTVIWYLYWPSVRNSKFANLCESVNSSIQQVWNCFLSNLVSDNKWSTCVKLLLWLPETICKVKHKNYSRVTMSVEIVVLNCQKCNHCLNLSQRLQQVFRIALFMVFSKCHCLSWSGHVSSPFWSNVISL